MHHTSEILAAMEWVTANHVKPAVGNMSLGGPACSPAAASRDAAVRASIAAGVVYVIAAGSTATRLRHERAGSSRSLPLPVLLRLPSFSLRVPDVEAAVEMETEKWNRARDLFEIILDLPSSAREAYLHRACGGDTDVLDAVREMIAAYESESFLEQPPAVSDFLRRTEQARGAGTRSEWIRTTLGARRATSTPPAAIGPYRILGTLGEGGMGVVYRGQHARTGELAAVKTVAVPNELLLAGIRREIHALARLRHPGIVRVLDEGLESGVPWYAMELLEGTSLRSYRSGATRLLRATAPSSDEPPDEPAGATVERRPVPRLDDVLTLVRRLCAPLSFLHGEGIVHRDLKPENVLVRPSGSPVLFDFGIASSFAGREGREPLDALGAAGGTLAYMAPEQIRGEYVDARADLYALGCILYELLTGRPPFVARSQAEYIRAHLESSPVRPSALVQGVPASLDDLVLRLLAKSPAERIGYADDVAHALGRLGGRDWEDEVLPRPRSYLYRPELAGRETIVEQLGAYLSAIGREGRAVLIGGESGVGKTRLALDLGRLSAARGARVLGGACPPHGAQAEPGALAGPLREPLRRIGDRCREHGEPETERLLGPRARILALVEPSLGELPGQERYPEPADLPPEAARLRLFDALAETFVAASAARPLVLILDDLQWADDLTLGFVEFFLRRGQLERTRMLFVGLYRSEEEPARLRTLLDRDRVTGLTLGRLDESAVASIVRDMLGLPTSPPVFSRYLARHSEGNPYFVVEYLREAVDTELLRRDAQGAWQVGESDGGTATEADYEGLGLPRSLRALAERRLSAEGTSGALASAAAVLGRESDVRMLTRMVGGEDAATLEAFEELLRRQVLEEASPGRVRFTHDKLREVAYERLAGEERTRLHGAAAEAIEASGLGEDADWAGALAVHWERAGEAPRARRYYLAAARNARARYAHADAERFYWAYLALADEPAVESIRARLELADEVLLMQGRQREQLAELERACEEAEALGERALLGRGLEKLGYTLRVAGRQTEATARLDRALEIATEVGERGVEGDALLGLASIAWDLGRWDDVTALLDRALACHRAVGDRHAESKALGMLGAISQARDRVVEARAAYEESLAVKRAIGDKVGQLPILNNLGTLLTDVGDFVESLACYERGLALAREIGSRPQEGAILSNMGRAYQFLGRFDEAVRSHREGLAICREAGRRHDSGYALTRLAVLEAEAGHAASARELFEEAQDVLREVGVRRNEATMLLDRAVCERRFGDRARAEELRGAAEAFFREAGEPSQYALCLCEAGHASLAGGRASRALVEEAARLAAAHGFGAESLVGRAVARLRRAVEAFEAGGALVNGESPEDLPPALRRRSVEEERN